MDWFHAAEVAITQIFLGIYVLLLVDFRQPQTVWRRHWLFLAGGLVAAHAALIAAGHFALYSRAGVITLVFPYTLATIWCSRHRDLRTVFSVANGFYVGCICGVNGYLAQALFPSVPGLSLPVRILSLILLFFVLRRFAKTCRQMLQQLEHGWLILCLIPITTSLITLYTKGKYFDAAPLPASVVMYGLLLICGCSYYLMYLFFERVQKEAEAQNNRNILHLQLQALQSRMDAVQAAEMFIRTERHDLRHRLQAIAELIRRGDSDSALGFLCTAQGNLDEQKPVRWCQPPVLDATFSSYFDQARRQGIRVDARIALSGSLAVDEGELAIVLANALENAIHASLEIPQKQREIRLKAISSPGLMLEIANPCAGPITFDEHGFPLSPQEGHGLGIQSISAFCKRHGAVCSCDWKDGWFSLQIIL